MWGVENELVQPKEVWGCITRQLSDTTIRANRAHKDLASPCIYVRESSPRGRVEQQIREDEYRVRYTSKNRIDRREMERERGTVNDSEGEGLYRYIPAAVVCNIMITLPGCLAASPLPRFPPTRPRLRGHPLSAAMLPGNMIIVIICTLLRPHPPDSSPPRGNPLILPLFSLPLSVFLSPIRATIVYRYDARNSVLAILSSSL